MHVLLVILAFVWWWPVGLALLGFVALRRMSHRRGYYAGEGQMMWDRGADRWERKLARAQDKMERVRRRFDMRAEGRGWFSPATTGGGSGNAAFDEYREQTLRRLEEEAHEFKDFLGRLRFAKDRAEFDQFMAERRPRAAEPGPNPEPPTPAA